MEGVRIIVGVVLPYVAVLVFVVGMIYQLMTWKRLASPTMTLFPAPPTGAGNARNVLEEALLFKSLFKGDRVLWLFAWVFHVVLALIVLGHIRVFTGMLDTAMKQVLGMTEAAIQAMSGMSGGAAGIVILVAVVLLLVRRMTLQRAREITGVADYLALLLIAAVIITGNTMRFGGDTEPVALAEAEISHAPGSTALAAQSESHHFDLAITRDYFGALATFSFSDWTPIEKALAHNTFFVHMCLAFLLIMAIPFSKILHLGGIFFTHQLIRKQ